MSTPLQRADLGITVAVDRRCGIATGIIGAPSPNPGVDRSGDIAVEQVAAVLAVWRQQFGPALGGGDPTLAAGRPPAASICE
jgi:hypothetical protein